MTEVQEFRSLPFQTRAVVWWGFMWRALVTTAGSMLGGAVAGGVLGAIAGMTGVQSGSKPFLALTGGAGVIVGIYFMWLWVHWLFRANIFGFRLQLVKQ